MRATIRDLADVEIVSAADIRAIRSWSHLAAPRCGWSWCEQENARLVREMVERLAVRVESGAVTVAISSRGCLIARVDGGDPGDEDVTR